MDQARDPVRYESGKMLDRYAAKADDRTFVVVADTTEAMAVLTQWWRVDRNHRDAPPPREMEQYRRLFEATGRIRVVDRATTTVNCGGERFTKDCVLVIERAEVS